MIRVSGPGVGSRSREIRGKGSGFNYRAVNLECSRFRVQRTIFLSRRGLSELQGALKYKEQLLHRQVGCRQAGWSLLSFHGGFDESL